MKKLYIAPQTEVFSIAEEDVIRTSLTKSDSDSEVGVGLGYNDSSWY